MSEEEVKLALDRRLIGMPIRTQAEAKVVMDMIWDAAKEYQAKKILALFDTELGFCHDPMGQEALNQLHAAAKQILLPKTEVENDRCH